ncbi:probable glycosly transferase [Calothrix sp. PCC 7716]|nr:probable glycosly transferase [Calothrix sp. PCC 7716]
MLQLQNKPKVSVVTSVYNGQQYFDKVVPSILNQTYKNFEWIIVDDGSTDSIPKLLEELASNDARVKVFYPGRLGRVKAFNYAISNAQGEYIANQDFDDISYPERLALQAEFLDTHPKIGLVGCNYIVNDQNRNERYVRIPPTEHKQIIRKMAKCVPFANTLVTYRKEIWAQTRGYLEMDGIEDLHLWIQFAKQGCYFGCINKVLGEHWVHSESFWYQNFKYQHRQKKLASIQWQAIRELNLPFWMGVYPLGRYVYCYSPKELKAFLRRNIAGSKEQDLKKYSL